MIAAGVKILLCTTPCDMRKQARGLTAIVERELGASLRSGHIFAFYNRGRDLLRLIFWDRSGVCVLSKRLDEGRFAVKKSADGRGLTLGISTDEFTRLLAGRSWTT